MPPGVWNGGGLIHKDLTMNTFNLRTGNPGGFPDPVINDQHLPPVNGEHPTVYAERCNDSFDFTTGECRIARRMDGIPFDTSDATLCASVGTLDIANGYSLRRLYRVSFDYWFAVRLDWWHTYGLWDDDFVAEVPRDRLLDAARALVPDKDCRRFLIDWYCGGWMPRCDDCARHWATHVLSGEDRETVLAAIAALPSER
ncbi:MAG TPA: hypothetical protein VF284_06890 [Rhodanobacteraceae bacterium]